MNTDNIEVFLRTVAIGNFSKAADELGYTQSGISHIITSFEKELGISLLTRDRSGVQLTEDGKKLYPYLLNLYRDREELTHVVNELHGLESGRVRIGALSSIERNLLPPIIKYFQDRHPNIQFDLPCGSETEIEKWVHEGRVDFGLIRFPSATGLREIPLLRERILAVLSPDHPLARAAVFPVERFAEEKVIMQTECSNEVMKRVFRMKQIEPNIVFQVKDDASICAMVESGLGISMLPEVALLRNPYQVITKELNVDTEREIGIVIKSTEKLSVAAESFLSYLKDQAVYDNWEMEEI